VLADPLTDAGVVETDEGWRVAQDPRPIV